MSQWEDGTAEKTVLRTNGGAPRFNALRLLLTPAADWLMRQAGCKQGAGCCIPHRKWIRKTVIFSLQNCFKALTFEFRNHVFYCTTMFFFSFYIHRFKVFKYTTNCIYKRFYTDPLLELCLQIRFPTKLNGLIFKTNKKYSHLSTIGLEF